MFYDRLVKIHMMAENELMNITVESSWEKHSWEKHSWEKHSVFKLPPHITSINPNAFKPNVISFGPYHYNEPHLIPMEAHKLRSLKRFLDVSNTTLQDLILSFQPMKQQLMDHYDHLNDNWRDEDRFLELMIRDGCFMLDILQTTTGYAGEYSANDPVFGRSPQSNAMYRSIKRDMLLIENQLPLLVLEKLIDYNMVVETLRYMIYEKIHELIMEFFETYGKHIQSHNVLCLHALDVFRENMIQRRPSGRLVPVGMAPITNFPPATELRRCCIAFKRNYTPTEITFEKGVLTLPHIFINKETEATFLNLMAFERFQAGKGQQVSAYIDFMGLLIRSAKDVSLLRSKNIITTSTDSDWEVAKLFRELARNQLVDPDDSFDEVRQMLADHYARHSWLGRIIGRIAEWLSIFNLTCRKTPWIVIGSVAGTIILVLTFIQTYYAALPYHKKKQ